MALHSHIVVVHSFKVGPIHSIASDKLTDPRLGLNLISNIVSNDLCEFLEAICVVHDRKIGQNVTIRKGFAAIFDILHCEHSILVRDHVLLGKLHG